MTIGDMTSKRSGSEPAGGIRTVLVDANVLINFIHIEQLSLLGELEGYRFVIPEHVVAEITRKNHTSALKRALRSGTLEQTAITDIKEMADYAEFHRTLGQGESACLAIAIHRDFSIASDEKRVFRRIVLKRIGPKCLLTTPDLILIPLRLGIITVEQADKWKSCLEKNRFKMKFLSFKELL
jgi:predicted nucleic acid-binding protein